MALCVAYIAVSKGVCFHAAESLPVHARNEPPPLLV